MRIVRGAKVFALVICTLVSSLAPVAAVQEEGPSQGLLTVAEASGFTATSRHADVMEFVRKLQRLSPLVRIETLAVSAEGRELPMMVIGNPPPASPQDLANDDRAVVYFQANIHAGEVEGKEATQMLARDIVLADPPPAFLDNLVVLIVPNFNPDGNDKISPENRRSQHGPEQGVGVRHNGQNLDLNREGMKLESPEAQGLVRNALMRWDPVLFLDAHTHNGSYHEEPVTYTWGFNHNADQSIIRYQSDVMMPAIERMLRTHHDVLSVPHGDFIDVEDPERGWIPAGPEARYLSNYVGLRNRLSLLNEQYPYVSFEERVLGCYALLWSLLEYTSDHKGEIVDLVAEADRLTVQRGADPAATSAEFGTDWDVRAMGTYTVRGYAMERIPTEGGRPRVDVDFDDKRVYEIPYLVDYYATRSVPLPYGYLLTVTAPDIEEKLLQHGLLVEKLTAPATLDVEAFTVSELESAERLFQGHLLRRAHGEYESVEMEFPAGTLFVTTAQPLGRVAASLLEPESDDGLLAWNFLDRYLTRGWGSVPFPIFKLMSPANFAKVTLD